MGITIESIERERHVAYELIASGKTCQQVAEQIGMSKSWVSKWCKQGDRPQRRWTEREVSRLMQLRYSKTPYSTVAAKLHRTARACRLRWMRERRRLHKYSNALMWLDYAIQAGASPRQAMQAVRKACVVGRSLNN